jgi:hypothetical protein
VRRLHPALLGLLGLLVLAAPPAAAFDLDQMPGAYTQPVHLSGPPGDATRLLVVERAGTIKLLKDETGPPTTYLDITAKVQDGGGEEGLLSMAFASTSRFYVAYTAGTGAASELVVEAYDVAPGGDTADPLSADEIIRIPHPVGNNHNGGQLQMGPDGNLWISTGDGGGTAGDSDGDAQDLGRRLGKILRITPGADGGYTIPAGNPYAGGGGAAEVWAAGLRNPWRFSFDRGTGHMYIGDVGEGTQEEVDRAPTPGLGCRSNYGWPWFEGDFVLGSGAPPPTHHEPLIVHTHDPADPPDTDGDWAAVAGGYVIRDTALGDDIGKYVYADTYIGRIWRADPATGATGATGELVSMLVSFGEDGVGRLYAVSFDGEVHRLVHETTGASEGAPALVSVTPTCGTEPAAGGGTTTTTTPPGDGTTPPGEPPPATTPPPGTTTGPRITGGTLRRQRALRRRSAFVRVGCDMDCTVSATGRLAVRRARFHLRGGSARVAAGGKRVLRLRIGRRALRSGRRALRRGARVRMFVLVRATAANGQQNLRTLAIRVIG